MEKIHRKSIIIGGGAAGLYLGALLSAHGLGTTAAVVESSDRLGRKLAASGNGQGNVSNADMSEKHYFGSADGGMVADIIKEDVLGLFDGLFTEDSRGRIYPAGRQASALADDLRLKIERGGVTVMTSGRAAGLQHANGVFTVTLSSGECLTADNVILACGGNAQKQFGGGGAAYALAEGFGHKITALAPSLVQLKTDTADIKTLKGLRVDCVLTAVLGDKALATSDGEIIFADYGVTGSAVFNISPYITNIGGVTLEVEFLPGVTQDAIAADIKRKKTAGYADGDVLALTLHKQLSRAIVRAAGSSDPETLAKKVKRFPIPVTGTLGFDHAQVTRGGIDMRDVTSNLESKLRPGLYFAGEILDVDGECGGYNLHWAFASAKRVFDNIRHK